MKLFDFLCPRDRARMDELERQVLEAIDQAQRDKDHEFLKHVDRQVEAARIRLNGQYRTGGSHA